MSSFSSAVMQLGAIAQLILHVSLHAIRKAPPHKKKILPRNRHLCVSVLSVCACVCVLVRALLSDAAERSSASRPAPPLPPSHVTELQISLLLHPLLIGPSGLSLLLF